MSKEEKKLPQDKDGKSFQKRPGTTVGRATVTALSTRTEIDRDLLEEIEKAEKVITNLSLFKAVYENDVKNLEICITKGADLTALNSEGLTPLEIAVGKDRVDIVKTLVEHKAPISIVYPDGSTLLHHAVEKGNTEIVKALIGGEPGSRPIQSQARNLNSSSERDRER